MKDNSGDIDVARNPVASLKRRSPLQRLKDWLFGYDFFVSYRWSDGAEYASNLAKALEELGFECFLDSEDFEPGGNWLSMGRRALRRTFRLVLVATPDAITDPEGRHGRDDPIIDEVSAFVDSKRHKVRIQFDDFLSKAWNGSEVEGFFMSEDLYLSEPPENRSNPSAGVISELVRLIGIHTQSNRRAAFLGAGVLMLALLLIAAIGAGSFAWDQRGKAQAETKRAQTALKRERASRSNLLRSVAERDRDEKRRDRAAARFAQALAVNPLDRSLREEVVGNFARCIWFPARAAGGPPAWAGFDSSLGSVVVFHDGSVWTRHAGGEWVASTTPLPIKPHIGFLSESGRANLMDATGHLVRRSDSNQWQSDSQLYVSSPKALALWPRNSDRCLI